jgi:hypothetical protein
MSLTNRAIVSVISLRDELRQADERRIDALFDDMFASPTSTAAELEKFTDGEMELALQNYGILRVIHDRIDETLPYLHERGMSDENLGGIVTGMQMVIMAIAAYADTEIPDSPEGT